MLPGPPRETSLDANFAVCELLRMKLAEYLSSSGTRLTAFAKEVGVSVSVAHDWKTGRRTPRAASLAIIEKVTGGSVAANDFVTVPSEEKAVG
jgi:DNA-binding transcriptional regulator YdaS (Cro superfamily)